VAAFASLDYSGAFWTAAVPRRFSLQPMALPLQRFCEKLGHGRGKFEAQMSKLERNSEWQKSTKDSVGVARELF
jgi:hypothetical protein